MPRARESTTDLSAFARTRARKKTRNDGLVALKRRVRELARLEGAPLVLDDGLYVARPTRILDASLVVSTLRERGALDRKTLPRAIALAEPPLRADTTLFATASRELRALASRPALAMAREHKRALSRYGTIDERWLDAKRTQLARLEDAPPARPPEEWFDGVVEIVHAVRGEDAARALAQAGERISAAPAERRRRALERIAALDEALTTSSVPDDAEVARLARRLEAARDLPGRARRRRVLDVLRHAVDWPEAPAEHVEALASPMSDDDFARAANEAGKRITASLPRRDRREAQTLLETVAWLGLLFRIGAEGMPTPTEEQRTRITGARDELVELAGRGLSLGIALRLLELPMERGVRRVISRWVADGLEIERVVQACKDGHAGALCRVPDARAARAYLTWASRLAAHYRGLGVAFSLSPDLFTNLPRDEDLGVLAICLMEHAREPTAAGSDPIAVLDATLGLFRNLPGKAKGILGRLRGVRAGVGREAFGEDLASWLGDDALLDRYAHVVSLAGEPVVLTKRLREDFDHAEKAGRERAHLESMRARSSRQETRLQVLRRGNRTLAGAPRGRTRRRILTRIETLIPIAYRRELDRAFREILRDAWQITVPAMTPAWRDAVRFWLVVDDNRELLGNLLREAARAPGRDIKLAFPKNRAWIEEAKRRIDVAAWMAPRTTRLSTDDGSYVLTLEEDPLEVLRMGIPFATCLALENGCNAASTVVNAIDANKRVLYVRSAAGKVVARKLLAMSKDFRIVGYNFYLSTRGGDEQAIRTAVFNLCRELAAETGAPLASMGEPANLYDGFWYDDSTVPFEEDGEVGAYCRSLGLEPPAKAYDSLLREGRGWAAMQSDDVEAAVSVLGAWDDGPANVMLGRWVVDRLGERGAEKRAAADDAGIYAALLRTLSDSGEDGIVRTLETTTRLRERMSQHRLGALLARFPPNARIAEALAEMGARAAKRFRKTDDHGLVHESMNEVPHFLDDLACAFDVLDRVEPVWAQLTQQIQRCEDCRRFAVRRSAEVIELLYERAPDDAAVVACLSSRHRSESAQRAALRVAARYALEGGERAIGRLLALRPALAETGHALAATLRQARITDISALVARRLPTPKSPPFEALGDLLVECDGLERILGTRPTATDLEAWDPGPWELAWLRRRGESSLTAELFEIAARDPCGATRAKELLALLGDAEAIRELADRCRPNEVEAKTGGAKAERPKPAKEIKTDHRELAISVGLQVRAEARGRVEPKLLHLRCADAAYADLARRALLGAHGELDERTREAALAAVFATSSKSQGIVAWSRMLLALARRGDDASLRAIVDEKVPCGRELRADVIATLYERPALRDALARSVARGATDDWAARVWAVERAADRAGASADGLLEQVALAIIAGDDQTIATDVVTSDQLRSVVATLLREAPPERAVKFYADLDDAWSVAVFVRAVQRLPIERAAAIREAASKVDFRGDSGEAKKEWLLATRRLRRSPSLRDANASSIEPG